MHKDEQWSVKRLEARLWAGCSFFHILQKMHTRFANLADNLQNAAGCFFHILQKCTQDLQILQIISKIISATSFAFRRCNRPSSSVGHRCESVDDTSSIIVSLFCRRRRRCRLRTSWLRYCPVESPRGRGSRRQRGKRDERQNQTWNNYWRFETKQTWNDYWRFRTRRKACKFQSLIVISSGNISSCCTKTRAIVI